MQRSFCLIIGTGTKRNANGRKAVEEDYNWDKVAGYTEGVFNAALNA